MLKTPGHIGALGAILMLEQTYLPEPPLTTVLEARKLLGRKYEHLTDTQVQEILVALTLLARDSIDKKVPVIN